jgi:uncharacterized protein YbjT (DUF2867 family)
MLAITHSIDAHWHPMITRARENVLWFHLVSSHAAGGVDAVSTIALPAAAMRILVTGGYGLIGSAAMARLHRDGHDLVGAGRNVAAARRRFPHARWIEADFRRLTGVAAWRPLLADIDLVVNCVGVLQDGAGDDTQAIHIAGTCALFDACQVLGIRRVVHISAIGVDADGPSKFARTKAEAERHLARLDLNWIVLRPGLVLAPAAYGGAALLRAVAGCPVFMPLIAPDARLQIVSIDDLADTIALCAGPDPPSRVKWDVAHPLMLDLAEIAAATRQWLGFAPGRLVRVPHAVAAILIAVADLLGRLGWRSPLRSTTVAQLKAAPVGDPAAWMAATGMRPASLGQFFAAHPATVQDRWFARTYLLKPLAIGGLAIASVASGLYPLSLASGSLGRLHMLGAESGGILDVLIVLALVLLKIAFGLGVLVRATARAALLGMLLVTILVATASIVMFLGSAAPIAAAALSVVSTAIPTVLATLFALFVLDDR